MPCLFLILIFIGIAVHKDYGITWDEEPQREIGMVALKEISKKTEQQKLYLKICTSIYLM